MIQELESTVVSHYRLQRLLARGGMSIVYTAYDIHTGHTVAIKLVHNSERDYFVRFQREVQAIACLKHNHILPAIEYGVYGAWYYMVMPYIAYGTLKHRLAKGSLSTHEASRILTQLADALHIAHERGIVHSDIKPSNILLRHGKHVYLADFGLARHVQETSNLTLLGTPEYMAPELTEHVATPSSDIYALGVVLYQMLTGRLPFKSSTPIGLYWKHLREQPAAPSVYNPTLSHATDEVVLRALSKHPVHRFQNAREFAQAYNASLLRDTTPLSKIHVGTPAVAAVLLLCIMPSLLGFSFSYLTIHAQTPSILHATESRVRDNIALTQPVTPQRVTTLAKTPPFMQQPPNVLMSQRIVIPTKSYPVNDGSKLPVTGTPKPKYILKSVEHG